MHLYATRRPSWYWCIPFCTFVLLVVMDSFMHDTCRMGTVTKAIDNSSLRILENQCMAVQGLSDGSSLVATMGYREPALKVDHRVRMWSNVWSQELTNAAAVGRFAGSRSRHRITVRFSPRSFSSRRCVTSLDPSHGSSARPAMAS